MLLSKSVATGTLQRPGKHEEDVAVKVIELMDATEAQRNAAYTELSLLARISKQLAGHIVELKGFIEVDGERLCLAMERAQMTLRQRQAHLENKRLPLAEWVRHPSALQAFCARCVPKQSA